MTTEQGEVYLVDLGIAGKVRPMLVVSRKDDDAPRALSLCAPITTSNRGSAYEVPLGKHSFLRETSWANAQGIQPIAHHDLLRKLGRISPAELLAVKQAIEWIFELPP